MKTLFFLYACFWHQFLQQHNNVIRRKWHNHKVNNGLMESHGIM